MNKKLKRVLSLVGIAGAVAAGGVVVDSVQATPAQASAWVRVCNFGPSGSHAVRVLLANGWAQTVYNGQCSSNDSNATNWTPDHNDDVVTWSYTDDYYNNRTTSGSYWRSVPRSITIKNAKGGFSGGGSF